MAEVATKDIAQENIWKREDLEALGRWEPCFWFIYFKIYIYRAKKFKSEGKLLF